MKRITLLSFILTLLLNVNAQIILNGDFENNMITGSGCPINLSNDSFNTIMNNAFAFGQNGEIDIQDSLCGYAKPAHGNWFVSLATNGGALLVTDAVSLTLSSNLNSGSTYRISYYENADTLQLLSSITDSIIIGISPVKSFFGTQIYSSRPTSQTDWTKRVFTFSAPLTGKYLTIKNKGIFRSWNFIDNFEISEVTNTENHLSDESINMYPNPSSGSFNLSIPASVIEILVYNVIGELIESKKTLGSTDVKIEIMTNGVYLINILTDKQLITKKIVIDK